MTATQAPTPGPLSAFRVGTNSGHGHAWKRPDGVKMRCGGPRICAECAKDAALVADVVFAGKQSLAPTAPVEASGSEREVDDDHLPFDMALDLLCTADDMAVYAGAGSANVAWVARHAKERLEALRPQPSGETREACNVPPSGWTCSRAVGHDGPCAASPINAHEAAVVRGLRRWLEWDFEGSDKQLQEGAAHVLNALLALGGQQGEVVAYRQWCVSDKPHQGGWWQLIEKHDGDHAIATGGGKNLRPLYDTTPARAEAQDEGAAGEPVGHIRGIDDVLVVDWAQNVMPPAGTTLYAHPSPTPAADADSVRIPEKWFEVAEYAAERGLTVHESKMRLEEFQRVVTPQAIAALKSEGK